MNLNRFWSLIFIALCFNACKLDPKKWSNPDSGDLSNRTEQDSVFNASSNTAIVFEQSEFDFGLAVAGDTIRHAFGFKNSGTDTLFIYNVKTSCDCLFASSTHDFVMPGQGSSIRILYNTADKTGPQDRDIYITSNTFPPETKLKLKGYIKN